MSPEPDDYYVAPDEYSAYVGNRVTADRPDYSVSPSWDAGLTDSDYETLRGLGYSDSDLNALFSEFQRDTAYTPGEDAEEFIPPYTPGEDAKEFIPPYTPGEDAEQFPGGKPGTTPPAGGGTKPGGTGGLTDTFKQAARALGLTDDKGAMNPFMLLGLAGLMSQLGKGSGKSAPTGYQGSVPTYTAVRQQIQYPEDPNRRPGSGGRSYFTPMQYVPGTKTAAAPETAAVPAAQGGLMNLAKGRYLDGATDGMADKIPATIADKQPARLSHGEFVVPADVVSHLGNGNSNAGAERLYDMMDRIRKARTGNPKQGKQINPNKFLPT